MKNFSLIPVVAVGVLSLWAAQDFPKWGDVDSPASKSPVSSHFIGNTGGYRSSHYGNRSTGGLSGI